MAIILNSGVIQFILFSQWTKKISDFFFALYFRLSQIAKLLVSLFLISLLSQCQHPFVATIIVYAVIGLSFNFSDFSLHDMEKHVIKLIEFT